MSKKNKQASKRDQRLEIANPLAAKVAKGSSSTKPGSGAMLNMLLILTAILPFMFSRSLMDSTIAVRYGILAGFVLIFTVYFYGFRKSLITEGWPILIKIIFLIGILYGLWNLVSLFSATNKQQVYYGISRHFLNLLLLFIVSQIATNEEGYLIRLCKLLSVAAIIHCFIGVCQFYDLAFTDIPGNYKPYGLMGNRNLYGSAQVMLIPFAIFLIYKGSKSWKYLATLALAGIALSAILSQTRSCWLAGLGSALLSLLLVALFSPANRKKWIIGTMAGMAGIAALAFLLITTDKEGELSQSLKERTGKIFSTDTTGGVSSAANNVNERLKIWAKTTEVIKDNWVTGVGAGNWKVDVTKYGTEGLSWSEGKYIPDSPHNDYLLVMAEAGIPGALLYVGMWVMIALIAFKTIIKSPSEDRRVLNIVMLGGLAAFAIDSMFSFPGDRIEHSLYVYLMAGIILGTAINNNEAAAIKRQMKNWQLALFGLIAAFNLFLGFKKYSFEKHLVLSKLYEAEGSQQKSANAYQLSIEEGNKGKNAFVSLSPNGFPIESFIGLSYKGLLKYPEALKEMDQSIRYNPYKNALFVNKGTVYTDMNKFDSAILFYKQAVKLTPEFDIAYFNLATNYFQLKDYKNCLENLNKTDITSRKELQALKQQAEYQLALQNQSKDKTVEQK